MPCPSDNLKSYVQYFLFLFFSSTVLFIHLKKKRSSSTSLPPCCLPISCILIPYLACPIAIYIIYQRTEITLISFSLHSVIMPSFFWQVSFPESETPESAHLNLLWRRLKRYNGRCGLYCLASWSYPLVQKLMHNIWHSLALLPRLSHLATGNWQTFNRKIHTQERVVMFFDFALN